MVDKYSVIDWLKRKWGLYKKYWRYESGYDVHRMRRYTEIEGKVGRIALQSIQTLIKIKHLQKHDDIEANCFFMDGNADNGIELDGVILDKEDKHLVDTAKRLLGYGF